MGEPKEEKFDDDKLELLERQLADRITERIRPSLFRLYATVGGAVIAVLGFVGWDVVSDIRENTITKITTELDAVVEPKVAAVDKMLIRTEVLAAQADEIISDTKKQLALYEPEIAQLKATYEEVNKLNDDISNLSVDSKNFITIYEQELAPALTKLDTLSDQLQALAEQVKQLNSIAATQAPGDRPEAVTSQDARARSIETIIATTSAAERQYSEVRDSSTVFLQFATARRAQAEDLAAALKEKGYIVPGEDREDGAKRKSQVRYFHESDVDSAQRLAADTTALLREQGYSNLEVPDVAAQSLVNYSGKKPREGVLELWLDLPYRP